ncbi:hypothetical protein ACERK3_03150 [Phycisphaerales bacterium AB-hyl4]|uniref:Tetratricopeptide repeat protein n=1 Tax=Natronomicrosphaera hydrolytica TaxID=3242702 RepID=A0ABV4U114_9BACT
MTSLINRTWKSVLSAGFAAGVLLSGAVDSAEAQQRAGDDGRALDANQQVGGGGVNPQREQLDFRLRNDVVTGNVGGGRAFRDGVGYSAPGEFRDATGADDLFQFRRDSFGTGAQPGAPRGTADVGSVYRPYSSPHVARPRLQTGEAHTSPWSIDGQGALRGDVDLRIRPGRQQLDAFDRVRLDGDEGRWLEVSASPLLGVRSDVRPGLSRMEGREGYDPWREIQLTPDWDDPLQMREEDWEIDRSLRRSSMLDSRAYQLSTGMGTLEEERNGVSRVSPTLMLGNQLRSQVLAPERDRRFSEAAERRMDQLEQRMFDPLQSVRSVEPGEDVYLDLLAAMRERDAERDRGHEPDVEQRDRSVRRDGEEDVDDEAEADDPFALPEVLRRQEEAQRGADDAEVDPRFDRQRTRAEELLDRLDYDLPPLETLAGRGEGRANQMLREAEELLRDGRFFDAEAAYREIVVRDVDAPMARVGLAHAQLSAGMIRSAAMNLRTLFEQHPELIAARYDANLLPPADRRDWIAGELRRMMDDDRQAPFEAALMLAYLGYQQGDEAAIQEGLDAVAARDEHDGLLHVLRHIWLDEPEQNGER